MENNLIYEDSEVKANKFNVYCLLVIALLSILSLLLNEIGVFTLNKLLVRSSMLFMFFFASTPAMILFIHDILLKKEKSMLTFRWFKPIIMTIAYVSVVILCIALSFHVVMIIIIPTMMGAQYKKNIFIGIPSFLVSFLMVTVVTFGSFILGEYDANLLTPLTKEEAMIISNRLSLLDGQRIIEIITHYVLPRCLCVAALDYIGYSSVKRTTELSDIQLELSNKVKEEALKTSKMQASIIEKLADVIESRDLETGVHIKRTKEYVAILVNRMKKMDEYKDILTDKMCDYIINAAPLHDIGKITISDVILRKPGKLTYEEFEIMKTHTTKGGEIINNILNEMGNYDFIDVCYQIAVSHHEKWNGNGYPNGLSGEDIPLPGRIMAISDVFDALISKRVYKDAMPIDEAVKTILSESGSHFDPKIVKVFKDSLDEFYEVSLS